MPRLPFFLASLVVLTNSATAQLMTWSELTGRPLPAPTTSIATGPAKTDIVDLWLPDGEGPHPVVIMLHGGCWQKGIADRSLMNYAAEDLRKRGLAVWNIEYRGVDEPGGGYPGTFQDVAGASDALLEHAGKHNLSTDRIVALGHSAGGHLALWLAARKKLPKTSPLFQENPLPLHTVINSGGLADLKASAPVTVPDCLSEILDHLTGPPSNLRPNVFSDTSPSELLPFETIQISVNGAEDGIAPPILGIGYTEKARKSGDKAEVRIIQGAGHVELIAPGTDAFETQATILIEAFKN